jgi:phosphoribosylaminoimidazolecarboxamide formyltransferase/IMP cyclohydrolase
MIRAAAKNFAHLTVLCDPTQYTNYLEELRKTNGMASFEFRLACARQAFQHTASYDLAIATYLAAQTEAANSTFTLSGSLLQPLRYGENPHQPAAWYRTEPAIGWTVAEKVQGKELSYNNLVDLEAARRIIAEFDDAPAAVIIKHTNPCGVAIAPTIAAAYTNALTADSVSAFGGIVALNRAIDAATATALTQIFLECIVAPGCDADAQAMLAAKSKVRVLLLPDLSAGVQTVKVIAGGFLVQAADDGAIDPTRWQVVTTQHPTPDQLEELLFAWKVCRHVKSNAIVVSRDRTTLGIGAGQMNRVGSVNLALTQAGDRARGAVLASDGFFPFDDSVRAAAAAGIGAIVQPGGSLRDQDSIDAANALGLTMMVTGVRHFSH